MQQNKHTIGSLNNRKNNEKNINLTIDLKVDFEEELKNLINKSSQYTIPIFIPHKGCRNECVFCNQRRISGTIGDVTKEDVDNIIQKYLKYFKKIEDKKIEIAFFGGSFTGLDLCVQEEYLSVAYKYVKSGKVDSIRLSTRPDYISVDILKMLKKYSVKTIELGVQSLSNKVLKASKRGHDVQSVILSSKLIKHFGFNLGLQIMVGLPESTLENELITAKKVVDIHPNELRIYPVYVIEDSELYDTYKRGEYIPLEFDEAVNRTYEIMKVINKSDVKVIRMWLQSTNEICAKN